MKKIVILTGSELRHEFFYKSMIKDNRFEVVAIYSEGDELSLMNRTLKKSHSELEMIHAERRVESENVFFREFVESESYNSIVTKIPKGDINNPYVFEQLKAINPDLLICYGSSIVEPMIVRYFKNRFLNVHLGISPYYRGSGTNIWPIINNELDMIGATFMFIDEGIDTGKIIHQIRADIDINDSIHSIGNKLIIKMTQTYADIIFKFDSLTCEKQPQQKGNLYLRKDFDHENCVLLYKMFEDGIVKKYLDNPKVELPYIVTNAGLIA